MWLYGHRVAHLTEPGTYRYKLEFTDDALDVFGPGARVLSLALPFDTKTVVDAKGTGRRPVAAFLEGLLPEANLRRHVPASLGVTAIDKLALLRAVGAECAGAVQFLPEGEVPSAGAIRELTDDEVNRLIADLPTYHLPEGTLLSLRVSAPPRPESKPSTAVARSLSTATIGPPMERDCIRKISAKPSDWIRTQNTKAPVSPNASGPGCAASHPWRPTARSTPGIPHRPTVGGNLQRHRGQW